MSFGFDPLTATVFHPGNPEGAVKQAIGHMLSTDLKRVAEALKDERTLKTYNLTGRHAADRMRWIFDELEQREKQSRAKEAHRFRAEESNIYTDLRDGAIEDV